MLWNSPWSLASMYQPGDTGLAGGMRSGGISGPNDLLSPLIEPDYPPEPSYQLSADQQRQLRIRRILETFAAGAGAAGSGYMGSAMLQGVMGARDREADMLDQERRRQEAQYNKDRQRAELDAQKRQQDAQRQKEAQDLYEAYSAVDRAAHPDDKIIRDKAAQAARAGDRATLAKLTEQAAHNKFVYDKGYVPYDQQSMDEFERQQKIKDIEEETRARERVQREFPPQVAPRQPSPYQYEGGMVFNPNTGELRRPENAPQRPGVDPDVWLKANAQAAQMAPPGASQDEVAALAKEIYGRLLFGNVGAGSSGNGTPIAPRPAAASAPSSGGGQVPADVGALITQIQAADPKAAAQAAQLLQEELADNPNLDWASWRSQLAGVLARVRRGR